MSNNPWISDISNPLGLVVSNGNLYVGTFSTISCSDILQGTPITQVNLANVNINTTWSNCLLEKIQTVLAADGNFLYGTDGELGTYVNKIDITGPSLEWSKEFQAGQSNTGVCVTNGFLYVSYRFNIYKSTLDGETFAEWVNVGGYGSTSDGINLYVADGANTINIFPLSNPLLQSSLTGPLGVTYISCIYANGILYALDTTSNNITQFNLTAGTNSTFAKVLPVNDVGGGGAYGLAIDSNYLYATNFGSASVSRFPLSPTPTSNICFPAGTPIETDQGKVNIELLDPRIHTIKGKPILHITKTVTLDKYLIAFEKNSVSRNMPTEKTLMSREHKVLFEGQLVPAYRFLDHSREVKKVKYSGEVLYNVLLAKHTVMNVNGLLCETLHPENIIAKLYTKAFDNTERQDIIFQMNNSLEKKDLQGYKSALKRLR